MTNLELIQKFYASFSNGDANGMISCYHSNIVFTDPAFGTLKGVKAKSMWQMLLSRSKGGLHITYSDIKATENMGSYYYSILYLFRWKDTRSYGYF